MKKGGHKEETKRGVKGGETKEIAGVREAGGSSSQQRARTYSFHPHYGFLHLGDIGHMVLIGFELFLLDPLIDPHHQLPRNVSTIIHPCKTWGT